MIKPMDEGNAPQPCSGKTVVITGATSGIGWQAALDFARRGAYVIGVGRSAERAAQAEQRIRAAVPRAHIGYVLADLASQAQVRRAATAIRARLQADGFTRLDVLINNAGTYAGKLILTEDGFEQTFAVNHLAPFLLTQELVDLLAASGDGRVLTTSSGSHYRTWLNLRRIHHPRLFNGLWAYKTAKLCNVLFSAEFNRVHAALPVRAFAVDPGLVNTEIGFKQTDWLSRTVWHFRRNGGTHPEVPVRTLLTLAGMARAELETRYNHQGELPIYWKDSQPKTPSRAARSRNLARELWALSSRLCHPGAA
ncbi:MAG: SDR family NAD(P)-dependent oxidoreductase [Anaerolineae bacterium]|nr:SDR family NAD(P)-dependent oxidoreductase [Anaerolineae bacterium]